MEDEDLNYFSGHMDDLIRWWTGDTMVEETGNVRAIRLGMIKFMKRYMQDMDLMKNIVLQNEHAFDAKDDILIQFDKLKDGFEGVIDYNFYPVEIEAADKE